MSASLLGVFDSYQRSRIQFVQAVAEAANRPQNVEVMHNAGVMQLLRPLLADNVGCTPASFSRGTGYMHTQWIHCNGSIFLLITLWLT